MSWGFWGFHEVVQVARTVENNRSAQSHALNHRSSRSHCLITLSLRQIDAKGGGPGYARDGLGGAYADYADDRRVGTVQKNFG